MDPRSYWMQYVEKNGGAPAVAERLGIPYPTIASVCNGSRGIGRELAERMSTADPELDRTVLVWVKPTPKQGEVA